MSAITSVNQGFSTFPSVRLNRRGRLARTLVVLSLAIVAASVAGGHAGAQTSAAPSAAAEFITVTVAQGETLWALASTLADGRDTRDLVADIVEINSLATVDLEAGQKIRIPLS
jgi:nucleoid-associated protein YgaU